MRKQRLSFNERVYKLLQWSPAISIQHSGNVMHRNSCTYPSRIRKLSCRTSPLEDHPARDGEIKLYLAGKACFSVNFRIQALIFLASFCKCTPMGSRLGNVADQQRVLFLQAQSFRLGSVFYRFGIGVFLSVVDGRPPDLAIPVDRVKDLR